MRGRTALLTAIVVGAVLSLFIVLLAGSDGQRSATFNFEIVGEVAPPIEGPTIEGGTYDLRADRGDWVLVNFFASWCVGCRVEHPELVEFRDRHRDDNVEVVAVMFGDSERAALEFFEELGGDWPALVDSDVVGTIALDYGVTGVPETVLVAPTGRVMQKWVGANGVTANEIDAVIALASGDG